MNIILGTALNYNVESVRPFINSLRKHYQEKVILLVSDISSDFKKYLEENNVETYRVPNLNDHSKICSDRHIFYKQILEKENFESVLLTDVRDVVFQDNPFNHKIDTELEFFCESQIYKNCQCHRHWFVELNIHGSQFYENVADKKIICAGTTIGTKKGILDYLTKMNEELAKFNRVVTDQPTHAYLIYNNYFSNYRIYENFKGPVATLNDVKVLTFDNQNNLLNEDGSIVSVIHQWDRVVEKNNFYNKAIQND